MRINRDLLRHFKYKNFYDRFRDLYGKILTDSEINTILEKNEFLHAAYITNLFSYHEVDVPSEDISNYMIVLKKDNNLLPRLIACWSKVPTTTGEMIDRITDFKLFTGIDSNEIFCESHEFIIGTSIDNDIDSEFILAITAATSAKETADILKQHLLKLLELEDARQERAKYLLHKFKII